ncbi:hypothetical protein [Pseudoalteromonas rubra]|uniref:hypothetical protein n=1 Tax=Pseudoalteromonas rubra TaxID=43658 RepID=UPI000F7B3834|nr:hypothetical protein [Pseudoalteromonas rubra]
MKYKAILFLAGAGLLLTGCNSTGNSADDGAQANSGYRCKQVRSLGSNIPKTYCSTSRQRKEARDAAKDEVREMRNRTATSNIE